MFYFQCTPRINTTDRSAKDNATFKKDTDTHTVIYPTVSEILHECTVSDIEAEARVVHKLYFAVYLYILDSLVACLLIIASDQHKTPLHLKKRYSHLAVHGTPACLYSQSVSLSLIPSHGIVCIALRCRGTVLPESSLLSFATDHAL
jgi:hypothetical protein